MDKVKLIEALIDIETRGLVLSSKSFECGSHCNAETTNIMRKADEDFSNAILNLRGIIFSEGV
jgi:hypothetical protein